MIRALVRHGTKNMRLVELPEAGDRLLFVNPEQVVCLIDAGKNRTQIVTTGLSGSASISLIAALTLREVAQRLAEAGA